MCNKTAVSATIYMSLLRKYAMLSVLQVVVSVSYQIAFLVECCFYISAASHVTLGVTSDIRNVLQMLDCLLLILCVYYGLAREETVCLFL